MAAAFADSDDVAAMLQRSLTAPEIIAVDQALGYASGAIRRFTRQTLSLVTDDEVVLRGAYGRKLVLPERPVVDVTALSVAGRVVATRMYTLVGDELWNGPALSQIGNAAEFEAGGWGTPAVDVAVTYSHGFDPVPDEVVGICVGMVMRYTANPTGVLVGGETIGGYSYTLTAPASPSAYYLTDDEKEILRSFRRTWFQ